MISYCAIMHNRILGAVILVMFLLCLAYPVAAQDPEPTQTPTPANQYTLKLSSGSELTIVRQITYGEIAIVISVVFLTIFLIVFIVIRTVKLWLH